jgi:hypothetical protein
MTTSSTAWSRPRRRGGALAEEKVREATAPALPGVTVVAVMISESGSTAAWPL